MSEKLFGQQYGRMREPRRHRKDNESEEPKRDNPKKEWFFDRFRGKRVTLKLVTGETMSGLLRSDVYNKYDVLLTNAGTETLIPKHSIVFV